MIYHLLFIIHYLLFINYDLLFTIYYLFIIYLLFIYYSLLIAREYELVDRFPGLVHPASLGNTALQN